MYVIIYQVRHFFLCTTSTKEILIALKPPDTTSYSYTVVDFIIFDKYKVYAIFIGILFVNPDKRLHIPTSSGFLNTVKE
jgi:hypothetical protein